MVEVEGNPGHPLAGTDREAVPAATVLEAHGCTRGTMVPTYAIQQRLDIG